MANVTYAQTTDSADCPCAKLASCKCAAACNPCGYGYAYSPYYYYPYYYQPVVYRPALFGYVRPVVRYPYYPVGYCGYGYPYGYYPRYCW